ncbi:hypothetical protein NL676_027312 [Syzygium grande]|nr:hypothetical protein NL676_027312 [Syzygium grande]
MATKFDFGTPAGPPVRYSRELSGPTLKVRLRLGSACFRPLGRASARGRAGPLILVSLGLNALTASHYPPGYVSALPAHCSLVAGSAFALRSLARPACLRARSLLARAAGSAASDSARWAGFAVGSTASCFAPGRVLPSAASLRFVFPLARPSFRLASFRSCWAQCNGSLSRFGPPNLIPASLA